MYEEITPPALLFCENLNELSVLDCRETALQNYILQPVNKYRDVTIYIEQTWQQPQFGIKKKFNLLDWELQLAE